MRMRIDYSYMYDNMKGLDILYSVIHLASSPLYFHLITHLFKFGFLLFFEYTYIQRLYFKILESFVSISEAMTCDGTYIYFANENFLFFF